MSASTEFRWVSAALRCMIEMVGSRSLPIHIERGGIRLEAAYLSDLGMDLAAGEFAFVRLSSKTSFTDESELIVQIATLEGFSNVRAASHQTDCEDPLSLLCNIGSPHPHAIEAVFNLQLHREANLHFRKRRSCRRSSP
jgi:hypothetical protein